MGTHLRVLSEIYPMNIQKTGLRWFIDYHHMNVAITDYLFWKETIEFFEPQP